MVRHLALCLILLLASFGCQSVDEHPDASASQAGAPPDDGYPNLHSVPPRPRLSYPVRQQREIVGELLADRANARYTEQVIRYRTGLSSLPPPPAPPAAPEAPITELPEGTVIAGAAPPPEPAGTEPEPMQPQAPPRSTAAIEGRGLDDGSLDYMIDDMIVDTEDDEAALPPDEADEADLAPSAGPAPQATPPAQPAKEMGSERGAVNRLFNWLSGLFGGPDHASVATRPSPEVTGGRPPAVAAADPDPDPPEVPADSDPTGAGDAAAHDRPVVPGRTAGSASAEPRDPAERQALPAAHSVAEASTITITTSGIEIAPAKPARDPDPDVIAFAHGSAALPPDAVGKLERFLADAKSEDAPITVLGEGSPPSLALDRARAVGQALVRLGASAERLRMTMATDGAGDRARLVLAGSSGS